jgi:hypothetical protein
MKTIQELETAGRALRQDLIDLIAARLPVDGTELRMRSGSIRLRDPETDEHVHVQALQAHAGRVLALNVADLDGERGDVLVPIEVVTFGLDELFTLAGEIPASPV